MNEEIIKLKPRSNRIREFLGKFILLGFYSDIKKIKLDDTLFIKRATKSELSDFNKRIEISNHKSYEYILHYNYSSNKSMSYPEEIINYFQSVNVYLNLLKSGSAAILYCNHYVKDEITGKYKSIGFISEPRLNFYEDRKYVIKRTDLSLMKLMWSNYSKVINGSNKAFEIASRRYYYSFQKFDLEDKIIDLMIAFEALFLPEGTELSFKLSLRVSKFLEDVYQNKVLFEFMKEAYNLRSKVVHGSVIKLKDYPADKQRIGLKTKISELQEILRLALRKYVLKYSSLSNTDFIKKIDNHIIEGNKLT